MENPKILKNLELKTGDTLRIVSKDGTVSLRKITVTSDYEFKLGPCPWDVSSFNAMATTCGWVVSIQPPAPPVEITLGTTMLEIPIL
jgi:hypothetical protein